MSEPVDFTQDVSLDASTEEDCPIVDLLERPMSELEDDELETRIVELRQALASHQSLRALIKGTKKKASAKKSKAMVTQAGLDLI